MSSYGYLNKGYSDYRGLEPRSDGWNRGSYGNANGGYPDHVCRPVLIDAEGNKRPIISYNPHDVESYVTKTETIIEEVRTPLVQDYRYISTPNIEPIRDYGAVDQKVMPALGYRRPTKDDEFGNSTWGRPVSPYRDRPPKVEEFITKIQTEVGKPTSTRTGPLSSTFWRRYGNGDNNKDEWIKPSQNDYYSRNDNTREPGMVTNGGWVRPNQAMWATSPETALSKATNDLNSAVEYMKEAARSPGFATATTQPRFSVPVPQPTKRDGYADIYVTKRDNFGYAGEIIDSIEAARRYGNLNGPTRPVKTYGPTIDSHRAVDEYRGKRL